MKKAKSLVAVLIAALMAFALVLTACDQHEHTFAEEWSSDATNHWHAATCEHKDEVSDKAAHTWGDDGKCTVCGREKGDEPTPPPTPVDSTYTYRLATTSLPTAWNVHTYQSNDATTVLDYTEVGLYSFDYNDTKDGYKWVLEMASAFPEDVSNQYVDEKWGIEEGDEWKAIRVKLRDDLTFENGDPITANTFSESLQLLLNPQAANYRADSYYGGQFSIVGAEKFCKHGTTTLEDVTGGEGVLLKEDGTSDWANPTEEQLAFIFSLKNSYVAQWAATKYPNYDVSYVYYALFGAESEEAVLALDGKTLAEILADETLSATLDDLIAGWCTDPGEEFGFFCETYVWPDYSWDDVGVVVVDDTTIDFIIERPLQGFYLTYNLAGSMSLVHPETYRACISESQGVYTNSYGTSVDTYVGFGPYKLTNFVSGNILQFERNDNWYGYKDAANSDVPLYQTTNIEIRQASDANTRLQMFLAGQTDSYGLQATDMEDYQSSEYTYYTDGDSTWFIAMNPNLEGLTTAQELAEPVVSGRVVNKTVLTIKEFRMALSFSVDRAAYELALDPTGNVAKALYGNMIISDPENGVAYRTTDQAKEVICRFWGIDPDTDIGPGKEYEDIDEAIDSITGYDLAGAKTLFDEAYDIAVEKELIDPNTDWEVQIMIGMPSTSVAYYVNGAALLSKVWTEAVQGTKFEGRLTFKQSQELGSTAFSDYLKNNSVDILFGVGWTGSALDPYNLMEAYVAPNYQYDPGWDTTTTMLDIEIGGQILRASVYDWGKSALQGVTINATVIVDGEATDQKVAISAGTEAEPEVRLDILAAVEGAVLEQYDMIPVGTEASASLKGMRIQFYTEEYVYGMGRGGLKYMTYTMDDAEWAEFVQSQGGTLNYK